MWKNRGSDSDAVCHHRSAGSRDEAGSEVWGSVHGKGYFWGEFEGAIVTNGDFRRTCATVPQPSELRFGVVRAVDRGTAVLDVGPRRARERRGFGGFCSPF